MSDIIDIDIGDIYIDTDSHSVIHPHYYTSDLVGYTGKEDGVIFLPDYGWVMKTAAGGYYSPIFGVIDEDQLASA